MTCTTHSSKNRWKKLFKTAFIRLWNEKHFMIIKKVLRVLLIMKNEIRLLTFIINNQWQLKKRKYYSNSNARTLLISDYRLYLYFDVWLLFWFGGTTKYRPRDVLRWLVEYVFYLKKVIIDHDLHFVFQKIIPTDFLQITKGAWSTLKLYRGS